MTDSKKKSSFESASLVWGLCVCALVLAIPATLHAQDGEGRPRPSHASLEMLWGRDDYGSRALDGFFGIDRKWALKARLTKTRYAKESRTTELRVGGDVRTSPILSFSGSVFGRQEPNEIQATGFAPAATYEISHLWDGKRSTMLEVESEFTRYGQSGNTPGARALGSTIFGRMLGATVGHLLRDDLLLGASLTVYSYGGRARFERLNRATNDRRFVPHRMASLFPNYVQDILTVNGKYMPHEKFDVALALSTVRTFNRSTRSAAQELEATYRFDHHWSIASVNALSQTKNNGGMTFLSGFNLGYLW